LKGRCSAHACTTLTAEGWRFRIISSDVGLAKLRVVDPNDVVFGGHPGYCEMCERDLPLACLADLVCSHRTGDGSIPMVEQLIARMDRWLSANRPDYYALLQPGVSDAELDMFESKFAVKLPEAFRQLYRWRNGQDAASCHAIQDNRSFCALEDVAETKAMFDGMIGMDFENPRYWRRAWIPFLHNGGGSYLCLDLAAEEGGESGQLIAFWKQDQDRPVEFASMEAWLQALVASMEDGTLEWG
jgi:cell wall assembly regulator SMI1